MPRKSSCLTVNDALLWDMAITTFCLMVNNDCSLLLSVLKGRSKLVGALFWLGLDFYRSSFKFLLESNHFGILAGWCSTFTVFFNTFWLTIHFGVQAGRSSICIDFLSISFEKATILVSWQAGTWLRLAGAYFSLMFFLILLKTEHFPSPGWPGFDFHWFSVRCLL